MLIGYLNLTAAEMGTGLADATNALITSGVGHIYMDVDPIDGHLPQLEIALEALEPGDALVSPSVATLTRTIGGLLDLYGRLEASGASLRVLRLAGTLPLDTATLEGRAILGALAVMNVLPPPAGQAPFLAAPVPVTFAEAPVMRPRGRPATAVSHAEEVARLRSEGLRAVEIAACLGIGRASVYRILSQGSGEEAAGLPRHAPISASRFGAFSRN